MIILILKVFQTREFDWYERKFKKEKENIDFMHRQFLQKSDGGGFL